MMNSNVFQSTSDTQLQSQLPTTSKMSVMNFLCGTWKDYYRSDRTINRIFQSAGIHHQSFVKVQKTISINDDRYAVIIDTVNRKNQCKDRIIIDVIKGEPTWTQMMDITYGIGSDCNTRVIIYNVAKDRFCYCDWSISDFVLMSNEHGLSTYVLSTNVEKDRIKYKVIEGDEVGAEPTRNQFPSKYEMQRTKFMIDYHAERSSEPRPRHFHFNEWPSDGLIIFGSSSQLNYTYPLWEPEGVFMFIEAQGNTGQKKLHTLLKHKFKELEKCLGTFAVEYDDQTKLPRKISAKLLDVPFTEYLFSDEDERNVLICKILELDPYGDEIICNLIEE